MMPGRGGPPSDLCLIGQSVLQLETSPYVYRGMWSQINSIADVNYTPSQKPRQPVPGDEDYEDGMTIIYRLGGSQCDNSPRCPIVSVVCSCDSRPSQPETHTPVDDTDETLEQDGLKLDQLLRAFSLYEKKPPIRRSISVLRNLTYSYRGSDPMNPEQLKRLTDLLSNKDVGLQTISLLTITQLCRHNRNIVTFLNHGTLSMLASLLQCHATAQLHRNIAGIIEQMVTSADHAGLWLTTMVETGLTAILQRLRTSVDEPTLYSCACVLRTLARHVFFIPYIQSTAMEDIEALRNMPGRLRELYVEIFGQLLCHRDDTDMASVLDTSVFPTLTDILKNSDCHLQKQVLLILVSLTRSEGCLSVLRARVLPCILSLWLDSSCIRVRECAVFALCQLLSATSMGTRLEVLKEIGKFFHDNTEKYGYSQLVDGRNKYMRCLLRFERSLQDFTLSLAASIRREARMERDRLGNIIKVHLQPAKLNDHAHINTLCHLVVILGILMQLRIDCTIAGKKSQKRPQSTPRTPCRINENIVILQLAHGTTCVVDLLHVFTKKFVHSIGWTMLIESVKEAYRKNVAAKQRVSGAGMSTNTPQNRQRHDSVDLKGIFEVEEVNLILAILGVIHMWVSCSADDTNRCLCLSAKKSVPDGDRSTECTATDPKQENESECEKTKTQLASTDVTETAECDTTESVDEASGPEIKKKTSKMLKSTTEKMYLEMCDELRGQLGVETNSDCDHAYGHCCFCGGDDGEASSQQSAEDEAGCLDEGLRQAKLLQRDIRVSLFEAGILESVGPWLACTDVTIKRTVLDILSHMVQPLDELAEQLAASTEDKTSTDQTHAKATEEQGQESDESKKEPLKETSTTNGEVKQTEMKDEHKEDTAESKEKDKTDREDNNEGLHHINAPERDTRRDLRAEDNNIEGVHVEVCDPREDTENSACSQDTTDSPVTDALDVDHVQDDVSQHKSTSAVGSQDRYAEVSCQTRQSKHEEAVRALLESNTFSSTDYDQFARKKQERCQSASAAIRVRPSSGRSSLGRPSSGRPSGRPSSGRLSSGRPSSGKKAIFGRPPTGWTPCSWSASEETHPSNRPRSGHKLRRPSSAPKSMRHLQLQYFLQKQNLEMEAVFVEQDVARTDTPLNQHTEKEHVCLKDTITNAEVSQKQAVGQKKTSPCDNEERKEMSPKQDMEKKKSLLKLIRPENEGFEEQNAEKKEISSKQTVDKKEMLLIQGVDKRESCPKQRVEKTETSPRHSTAKRDRAGTHKKREKPLSVKGQPVVGNAQDKELSETKVHKRHPATAPKNLSYNKLYIVGRATHKLIEKTASQPGAGGKQLQSPPPLKRPGLLPSWKTQFNPSLSPVGQCHSRLVDVCGKAMLHELFSKDRTVKINMLCLLYQLAVHSKVHMLMSEKGVIHKLVDFLRVNDKDEYLQRMGLLLAQELFRHERRLNQLFCKLGGAPLLESMLCQDNTRLRPLVVETLSMLSGGRCQHVRLRPLVVETLGMLSGGRCQHVRLRPLVVETLSMLSGGRCQHVRLRPLVVETLSMLSGGRCQHVRLRPLVVETLGMLSGGRCQHVRLRPLVVETLSMLSGGRCQHERLRPLVVETLSMLSGGRCQHVRLRPLVVETLSMLSGGRCQHVRLRPLVVETLSMLSGGRCQHVRLRPLVVETLSMLSGGRCQHVRLRPLVVETLSMLSGGRCQHVRLRPLVVETLSMLSGGRCQHVRLRPLVVETLSMLSGGRCQHVRLRPLVVETLSMLSGGRCQHVRLRPLVVETLSMLSGGRCQHVRLRPLVVETLSMLSGGRCQHVRLRPLVVETLSMLSGGRCQHVRLRPLVVETLSMLSGGRCQHVRLRPLVVETLSMLSGGRCQHVRLRPLVVETLSMLSGGRCQHVRLRPLVVETLSMLSGGRYQHVRLRPLVVETLSMLSGGRCQHVRLRPLVVETLSMLSGGRYQHVRLRPLVVETLSMLSGGRCQHVRLRPLVVETLSMLSGGRCQHVRLRPLVVETLSMLSGGRCQHVRLRPLVVETLSMLSGGSCQHVRLRPLVVETLSMLSGGRCQHVRLRPLVVETLSMLSGGRFQHVRLRPLVVETLGTCETETIGCRDPRYM
ncbi:hypothetical protein NP493_216g02029 [Ridgeia piscesae]|uniref:Uncharacterized protein n=1 Tax=Ridgeia piscesae TaxID=27915 RepID=A0AAD9P0R7_RIDPI|nr:hypothetical protein NP493_216g02029 [Ridgeia piscesae]